MIHSIHHRHTGAVIFTTEIEADENTSDAVKLGLAVRAAVREGADLSRANLSRANLTGADLSWTNLSVADLTWADLTDANLRDADLSRADLTGANLSWANLSGADLSGADLTGANLSRANLSRANLRWADLSRANLSWANLTGADLTWADLTDANLRDADLSRADLSWANLTGTNLRSAGLSGANLKLADMEVVYTDTEKKNPTIGTLSEIGAKPGDMVEYVHGEKGQFILPDWPGKVLWDMSIYGIPHRLNKSNWRIVSRSGDAVRADATPILNTTGQLKYFGRDILSIFEQALRYADNPSPEHRSEFEAPASSGIGSQNGRILGSMIRSAKLVRSKDFGLARDEIFSAMIMMAKTAIEIDMQNPSGEEH